MMVGKSKTGTKILSLILLVVGVGLVFWGYQLSESLGSQMSHAMSGAYSDKEMTLYIGGAASFVVGLFLFFKK